MGRANKGSATHTAAYNSRSLIWDERTKIPYDFTRARASPVFSHEILVPNQTGIQRPLTASVLWNMAEMSEGRKDSQVAREIVLRLPVGPEITGDDRVRLARSFAEQHFVRNGLAVQVDIHQPETKKGSKKLDQCEDDANWHAHLLITTRRLEAGRLSRLKARDLDPPIRRGSKGRPFITQSEVWGDAWRHHQDAYFRKVGYVTRVDAPGIVPGKHHGPVRHRPDKAASEKQLVETRLANEIAARDPARVLAALVKGNATFAASDLDRFLKKHLPDLTERRTIRREVLELAEPLFGWETGEATGRYTAASVREAERTVLREAAAVAKLRHKAIPIGRTAAIDRLYPEQLAALKHIGSGRGLAVVTGRAGTGKSELLSVARERLEAAGYNVRGLGPTNQVAEQLRAHGFLGARTVHAELYAMDNGRMAWNRHTAVVIDEAAMLSTAVMGRTLAYAAQAKALVVLAGDDRQLGAVASPGGMFRELAERHGHAEVTKVIRQSVDWQRQASEDLSEGNYAAALRAYQEHHAIHWTERPEYAEASLVSHWASDTEGTGRLASRFVLAFTNDEVDRLNAELRAIRIDRGEIAEGERLQTKHGAADFSVGDRVQFTQTNKSLGISNGNAGTLTSVGQVLRATLDDGRSVSWSPAEFDAFRHGYAGTIYKGQGKTLERAYVLHSWHLSAQASYVAMTRHTHDVSLYVSRTVAHNMATLIRQMSRMEERGASLQWATRAEAPKKPAPAPEPVLAPAKLLGRSPIAMAIENYAASRPKSDLEFLAMEVARGFLDHDDLLNRVIAERMEGVQPKHYVAVERKAMDEVTRLVSHARAIVEPPPPRNLAKTTLQQWVLEMADGNVPRKDVLTVATAARMAKGEAWDAAAKGAEHDVAEAIKEMEPAYSARVIRRQLQTGRDAQFGHLAEIGRNGLVDKERTRGLEPNH